MSREAQRLRRKGEALRLGNARPGRCPGKDNWIVIKPDDVIMDLNEVKKKHNAIMFYIKKDCLDAGYCALSPVSFGLNAGGAGAGPGRHLAICLRLNLLALAARLSPPWLNYRLVAQPSHLCPGPCPRGPTLLLSPRGSAPRPRGSALSYLAGVGG